MPLILRSGTAWSDVHARCREVAPETFHDDRLLNYWGRRRRRDGEPVPAVAEGPTDERRHRNFPTHAHYPEV